MPVIEISSDSDEERRPPKRARVYRRRSEVAAEHLGVSAKESKANEDD